MEKTSNWWKAVKTFGQNYKTPLVGAGLIGGGYYGMKKGQQALSDTIKNTLNDPEVQNKVNQLASSGASSALTSLSDQLFTLPNMGKIMAVGALAGLPSMLMNATTRKSPNITVNQKPQHRQQSTGFNPRNYYSYRAR